jgi:hypothetical protein
MNFEELKNSSFAQSVTGTPAAELPWTSGFSDKPELNPGNSELSRCRG